MKARTNLSTTIAAALLLALVPACTSADDDDDDDVTAPVVIASSPVDGASDTPLNVSVSVTFSEVGDLVFRVASCATAQSDPSASSAAKMSSTVSKANSRSMASRWTTRGAGPASLA